jgi:molybdopterin converting factor subunit 1
VRVRVRLFATIREAVGKAAIELDLPEGASAEEAWQALVRSCPDLSPRRQSLAASVNRSYASFDTPLEEGDEVAFIPPVSGG